LTRRHAEILKQINFEAPPASFNRGSDFRPRLQVWRRRPCRHSILSAAAFQCSNALEADAISRKKQKMPGTPPKPCCKGLQPLQIFGMLNTEKHCLDNSKFYIIHSAE
jgi:hypothetical protein